MSTVTRNIITATVLYSSSYARFSSNKIEMRTINHHLNGIQSQDAILPKPKHESVPCWISILSLNNELNFIHPVIVKISYDQGDFIAECPKLNIFAFGNTYEETLDNLKEILLEDYKTYLDDYPDKLSHSGKKMLKLYLDFLGKDLPL